MIKVNLGDPRPNRRGEAFPNKRPKIRGPLSRSQSWPCGEEKTYPDTSKDTRRTRYKATRTSQAHIFIFGSTRAGQPSLLRHTSQKIYCATHSISALAPS